MDVAIDDLLSYDPETGIFRWKVNRSRARIGAEAGYRLPNGYIQIAVMGRHRTAARVAWRLMTGEWPEREVDHINRCRDDNRWVNLRLATVSENRTNRTAQRNNKCGLKGVFKRYRKWLAYIRKDKRTTYLGSYATKEEAHQAYCMAAKALYGEFASS